jgi:hypothetical protein
MVCIHQQEVDNKRHAEKIEEDYRLELNANMNMIRAFLSPEQKKEYHKDYDKEYIKEWREQNKARIKEKVGEKITCECGFTYTFSHKSRHMKSQRHIKLMENI